MSSTMLQARQNRVIALSRVAARNKDCSSNAVSEPVMHLKVVTDAHNPWFAEENEAA